MKQKKLMEPKPKSQMGYILSTSRKELVLAVLGFFLVIGAIVCLELFVDPWWSGFFADYPDPIIAIGTLVVAILVWVSAKLEGWRSTWPKKLQIYYLLRKDGVWKKHIAVMDAPLTSEADIRSWGQSIGQTVVPDSKDLIDFSGFKIVPDLCREKDRTNQFGLLIFLSKPIKGARDGSVFAFDVHGSEMLATPEIPNGHPILNLDDKIPT